MQYKKQELLNTILELKVKEEIDVIRKMKEICNNATAHERVFNDVYHNIVGVLDECNNIFKYNYILLILELQNFEYIVIDAYDKLASTKYSNEDKLEIHKLILKMIKQYIHNINLLVKDRFINFCKIPKLIKLDKSFGKYNEFLLEYYEKINNCLYEIEKNTNRFFCNLIEIYKYIGKNEKSSIDGNFLEQFRDIVGILIDEYETKYLLTLKYYTENNNCLCIDYYDDLKEVAKLASYMVEIS